MNDTNGDRNEKINLHMAISNEHTRTRDVSTVSWIHSIVEMEIPDFVIDTHEMKTKRGVSKYLIYFFVQKEQLRVVCKHYELKI